MGSSHHASPETSGPLRQRVHVPPQRRDVARLRWIASPPLFAANGKRLALPEIPKPSTRSPAAFLPTTVRRDKGIAATNARPNQKGGKEGET